MTDQATIDKIYDEIKELRQELNNFKVEVLTIFVYKLPSWAQFMFAFMTGVIGWLLKGVKL